MWCFQISYGGLDTFICIPFLLLMYDGVLVPSKKKKNLSKHWKMGDWLYYLLFSSSFTLFCACYFRPCAQSSQSKSMRECMSTHLELTRKYSKWFQFQAEFSLNFTVPVRLCGLIYRLTSIHREKQNLLIELLSTSETLIKRGQVCCEMGFM